MKRSIQKEKKRHQKNVEKWKERVVTQQKMKAEKQQTRSQNIAERIHQKKMRWIAKREKSSCGKERMVTIMKLQLKVPLSKHLYGYPSLKL